MSRSAVQVGVGGKTQFTSVISIGFLILVIFVAGPLFEDLPKAVLSAIILVALKSMLLQFHDFPKILKKSKLDAALWMLTFIAVMILNIDTGLLAGIIFNLILLLLRSVHFDLIEVAEAEKTGDLFLEVPKDFEKDNPEMILKLTGALNFANAEGVVEKLKKRVRKSKRQVN